MRRCTPSMQPEPAGQPELAGHSVAVDVTRIERSVLAKPAEVGGLATIARELPTQAGTLRHLPDADLLALISRGDLHALEVVYDRHIGRVWRVALEHFGDVTAAEAAVSKAFLGVWRRPRPGHRAVLPARLLSSVRREAARGSSEPPRRRLRLVQPLRRG